MMKNMYHLSKIDISEYELFEQWNIDNKQFDQY